jgi:hypothetical protein
LGETPEPTRNDTGEAANTGDTAGTGDTPKEGDRKPLSTLLRQVSLSGRSYRKIAEDAIDPVTGEQLDHRYLNDIVRGKIVSCPPPARLRALAAGLHVGIDDLKRLAAIQYLEYDVRVYEGRDGELQLWTTARQLSAEDLDTVRRLASSLLERATARPDGRKDPRHRPR